jgi:hypothetical protein
MMTHMCVDQRPAPQPPGFSCSLLQVAVPRVHSVRRRARRGRLVHWLTWRTQRTFAASARLATCAARIQTSSAAPLGVPRGRCGLHLNSDVINGATIT